jgi:hypothetical protein
MKTGQRSSRPCVHINARDVIEYCKNYHTEPTHDKARSWLANNRRHLERAMRSVIKARMQDILDVALWDEYFDPALNEQFIAVDAAISSVLHDHGVAVGGEHNDGSYSEAHMKQVLEYLVSNPIAAKICLEYDNEFRVLGHERTISHRTDRVHLIREQGKLKAEVVHGSSCAHIDYLVIPVPLENNARAD